MEGSVTHDETGSAKGADDVAGSLDALVADDRELGRPEEREPLGVERLGTLPERPPVLDEPIPLDGDTISISAGEPFWSEYDVEEPADAVDGGVTIPPRRRAPPRPTRGGRCGAGGCGRRR